MGLQIEDGTGRGYSAGVTSGNRLLVTAISEFIDNVKSTKGFLFGTGTGFLTLPIDFNGPVFQIKNADLDKDFYVVRILLSWGGSNCIKVNSLFNAGEPTANSESAGITNLNLGSNNLPVADLYKWDGSGSDGMTISGGTPGLAILIDKGLNIVDHSASIIINKDSSITFNVDASGESNVFALSMVGYFDDIGEL